MVRRLLGVAALLALASCKARAAPVKARPTANPTAELWPAVPTATASAAAAASAAPSAAAPAALDKANGAPPIAATGDLCRLSRGPIQLSFTGAPALWPGEADQDPHIVFNRDGVPRAVTLPAPAAGPPKKAPAPKAGEVKKPERLALAEPAERATTPGCAAAGAFLFCVDKAGAVHRTSLAGEGDKVVAQARPGAPFSATMMGAHVLYAFLGDRKTTEGTTTLAFAGIDDAAPITLSEEGSGATFVSLATRGEEAVAMYVDARRAMTPVHARVLTATTKLTLGPDAVVFVGEGSDGRVSGALARGGGGGELALLPAFKDVKDFGMAAIRIDEQPHDDSAATWSMYPAGIDGAVIAATQGVWPVRVLRSRPATSDTKGKKVLELGELDAAGVFKPLCAVAESSAFADPALLVDRAGALWIAYTDADGTWIERRGK